MGKKIIQLSVISNQLKKEYWINPLLDFAVAQMAMMLGRPEAPYGLIFDPMIGCETSQVARNFASWHCIEGHRLTIGSEERLIKPDFLMMLDSDMSPQLPAAWSNDGIEKCYDLIDLVKQADEGGYPIFGALYPGWKYQKWFLHAYRKNRFAEFYEEYTWQDLIEWRESGEFVRQLDAIGTGAIVIRREVLEAVWAKNEKLGVKDRVTGKPVVFERGRDNIGRTYHGEDLMFCSTAQKLGFMTYGSIGVLFDHYHTLPLMEIPPAMGDDVTPHTGPVKVNWTVGDYGLPVYWQLPEITAWSMTPGGCRILKELLKQIPINGHVLELGPGVSSGVMLFVSRFMRIVFTRVENNKIYHQYLMECDPSIMSFYTPLVDGFYEYLWYTPTNLYHLIVVDGPPSHEGTREPAMYRVWDHWVVGGYLVLDDVGREPERSIMEKWKADFAGRVECEVREDGYGRQLAVFRKITE